MKIKLDDKHFLNSDPQCYWISCKGEVEKGKNAGKVYERRVSGYVATFEQVMESYIENRIRSLECEKLSELKKEIQNLKKTVKGWKGALK